MKQMLIAIAFTLLLTVAAQADTVQLDDTFTKTNQWLKKDNLSLTGGPTGRDDGAAFSQEAILFYGEAAGNPAHQSPAQRELMAKRAAVVIAQRAIAEYLEGFALVGDTLVKDGMAQSDIIRSSVASFVRGTQVVFQEYNKEKDIAVAIVKIGLHGPKGFASLIYNKITADPKLQKELTNDKPDFRAELVKLDTAYDGLIIDAGDQNFKPALINRIFTAKGEVLYDPARISQKVLVEQGCGEYTNDVNKAKAALAARGVQNPLIVKATGAMTAADLQISDDDAVKVFTANQKSAFLAGAKVAFVVK